MPEYAVNLLIQVPLVGMFIFYALRTSADNRADASKRDEQWRSFLEQQAKSNTAFIEQQNVLWRGFIKDMNDTSCASGDLQAQRLMELAQIISGLRADFKEHDQRVITKDRH